MIPSSREADSPILQQQQQQQQQGSKRDETSSCKAPSSSSSSPLLRSRDPRIVRVSRAFGGKDRHSKVFTVRGLRDRRVRLSVPTAIQLYDLQDRLGLNQPSKVVDWLLNEAKHEIDELPPLPIPPGSFALNHQIALNASQEPIKRAKSKETARESNEEEEKGNIEANYGVQRSNHSSMQQSSLNNAVPLAYGSYYHHHVVEPSNFGLSHIGGSHGFAAPHSTEELHSFNFVPLPSTLSLSSSGSQANHFQMLMSSGSHQNPSLANPSPYVSMSQPFRPFHLSITPRLHPDKEDDQFPSK